MSMQVPDFLLRRLYVAGSLTNTEDGFAFKLHNSLGSGYAEELRPLRIDGEEVSPDETFFSIDGLDGAPTAFSSVTKERPFTLEMDKSVTIAARGRTLAPGEHTISMTFVVAGLGEMTLEVSDRVGDS